MKKGEVWQVDMPGGPGHAQAGIRPAVIVQNDQFLRRLPMVLIVPFTSRMKATNFPGTLIVQPDGNNGLTVPSVALVFQLFPLDKVSFLTYRGVLDPRTLDQIEDMIQQLTC